MPLCGLRLSIDEKVHLMLSTMLSYKILILTTDERAFTYDFVYHGSKMEHGRPHRMRNYSFSSRSFKMLRREER